MNGEPPGQAAQVNPPFQRMGGRGEGKSPPQKRGSSGQSRGNFNARRDAARLGRGAGCRPRPRAQETGPPDRGDVAQKADSDYRPKRKPIPDGAEVAQKAANDYRSKRKPIPDGAEVAQKVDGDYKPKRKPIPDGAEVVGKVDGDYRLKRPRGRRRIPAALKPKSGYKPRGTGARGTKSRVTAPRKIGAFVRQVRKG